MSDEGSLQPNGARQHVAVEQLRVIVLMGDGEGLRKIDWKYCGSFGLNRETFGPTWRNTLTDKSPCVTLDSSQK
jgi:hypothetical protein